MEQREYYIILIYLSFSNLFVRFLPLRYGLRRPGRAFQQTGGLNLIHPDSSHSGLLSLHTLSHYHHHRHRHHHHRPNRIPPTLSFPTHLSPPPPLLHSPARGRGRGFHVGESGGAAEICVQLSLDTVRHGGDVPPPGEQAADMCWNVVAQEGAQRVQRMRGARFRGVGFSEEAVAEVKSMRQGGG